MTDAWVKLDIFVPYKDILAEANAVEHLKVEHRDGDYSYGVTNKGWHALTIYGVGSEITIACNEFHHWTEIADRCPKTVEFLKKNFEINEDSGRIRFMWLEPGGLIAPHKDKDHKGYGAVNIAIDHPKNCSFIFKGIGTVPYESGQAYLIDTSYEHMVINKSNQTRLHMIVHAKPKQ